MKSNAKNKRILLVDDDETNNFICKKMFNIFDPSIETVEFLDPVAALRYLQDDEARKISLLLLDLNMPKINGWQFLETMGNGHADPDIVILTSSIDPNDLQKAQQEIKIKDFWPKPLTFDMLGKYFAR